MLKRIYDKSQLTFAITWIVIYVIVMSNLRANVGDTSIISVFAVAIITGILIAFIFKNNLSKKYGFVPVKITKKYLYFIPLLLLCTVNLWFGTTMNYSIQNQIFAVLTLGMAGIVEEIIFRGLLFKAIEDKDNAKWAIIITAITFGIGHIVNLFTGHAGLETYLQIGYAVAVGFAFVMIFYKTGSLLPSMIAHFIINTTSTFIDDTSPMSKSTIWEIIVSTLVIVVAGGYSIYLIRVDKENT